jgi:hypothetical protein
VNCREALISSGGDVELFMETDRKLGGGSEWDGIPYPRRSQNSPPPRQSSHSMKPADPIVDCNFYFYWQMTDIFQKMNEFSQTVLSRAVPLIGE